MTYTKQLIRDLMGYVNQQIKNNDALVEYIVKDKEHCIEKIGVIENVLKENKMYANLLDILMNTETID